MCKVSTIIQEDEVISPPPKDNERVISRLRSTFPRAVTNAELVDQVVTLLAKHGFDENTLLATSLCCDKVNGLLEQEFRTVYDSSFRMGGLAGFPFGGNTSFRTMADHIPEDGSCLIVYGPHVGIDSNGVVGMIDGRAGCQSKSRACCGSAAEAANHICKMKGETSKPFTGPTVALGAHQAFVRSLLMPYARHIGNTSQAAVELPFTLFEAVDDMMKQVVARGAKEIPDEEGRIALLGGIQINTPGGLDDYFLPLQLEVRDSRNHLIESLLSLHE